MWKNSIQVSVEIYQITQVFPSFETYGLGDQMRRAAVSISSNIAEGASRKSEKDFGYFLQISLGSAYEVETQLYIAYKLGYINKDTLDNIIKKISSIEKQLHEMIQRLTPTKPKS